MGFYRKIWILMLLLGILYPSALGMESPISEESNEDENLINSSSSGSSNEFSRYPGINLPESRGASRASPSINMEENEKEKVDDVVTTTRRMKFLQLRQKQIEDLRRRFKAKQSYQKEEEKDAEKEEGRSENEDEIPTTSSLPLELELEMLRNFKKEWQRYEPEAYSPPASYFPSSPYCSCNLSPPPPPSSPPFDRSLPIDVNDEDEPYFYPIPNRPRYMTPLVDDSRPKRSKRSVSYGDYDHHNNDYLRDYDVDPYWYDQGPENEGLKRMNLGYAAWMDYQRRLPYYLAPLHFGKVPRYDFNYYDGHAFHRSRKSKIGYH